MSFFNFIKKKKKGKQKNKNDIAKENKDELIQEGQKVSKKNDFSNLVNQVDKSKLSLKEKMALKMFDKLPDKKKEEVLQQAMNPQKIKPADKNKILSQIDEAVARGEIDKSQAEAAKSRLGLR